MNPTPSLRGEGSGRIVWTSSSGQISFSTSLVHCSNLHLSPHRPPHHHPGFTSQSCYFFTPSSSTALPCNPQPPVDHPPPPACPSQWTWSVQTSCRRIKAGLDGISSGLLQSSTTNCAGYLSICSTWAWSSGEYCSSGKTYCAVFQGLQQLQAGGTDIPPNEDPGCLVVVQQVTLSIGLSQSMYTSLTLGVWCHHLKSSLVLVLPGTDWAK